MDGIGSLTQGSEVGEYLSIAPDPDAIQITDAPDGGAFIDMAGDGERDESAPPDEEFYGNLATARTVGIGDSLVINSGALTVLMT